jgi:hypothetical protein
MSRRMFNNCCRWSTRIVAIVLSVCLQRSVSRVEGNCFELFHVFQRVQVLCQIMTFVSRMLHVYRILRSARHRGPAYATWSVARAHHPADSFPCDSCPIPAPI